MATTEVTTAPHARRGLSWKTLRAFGLGVGSKGLGWWWGVHGGVSGLVGRMPRSLLPLSPHGFREQSGGSTQIAERETTPLQPQPRPLPPGPTTRAVGRSRRQRKATRRDALWGHRLDDVGEGEGGGHLLANLDVAELLCEGGALRV